MTDRNDGMDNDADGWQDALDPDRQDGGIEETGFGDTQCNDGINNDPAGDLLVDAADPDCITALDDNETTASSVKTATTTTATAGSTWRIPTATTGAPKRWALDRTSATTASTTRSTASSTPKTPTARKPRTTTRPHSPGRTDYDDGDGWVDLDDPDCIEALRGGLRRHPMQRRHRQRRQLHPRLCGPGLRQRLGRRRGPAR